ncbi:MAG: hypothetical protein ACLRMZ_22375 [Blautia marasmi]
MRSDDKITSGEELEAYMEHLELLGQGERISGRYSPMWRSFWQRESSQA